MPRRTDMDEPKGVMPSKIVWHPKGKSGDLEYTNTETKPIAPKTRDKKTVVKVSNEQTTESDVQLFFDQEGNLVEEEGRDGFRLLSRFNIDQLMILTSSKQFCHVELALRVFCSIIDRASSFDPSKNVLRRISNRGLVLRLRMLLDSNSAKTIKITLNCIFKILTVRRRSRNRTFFVHAYHDQQIRCPDIYMLDEGSLLDQFSDCELCAIDPIFGLVKRTNIMQRFCFLMNLYRSRDRCVYERIIEIIGLMLEHSGLIALSIVNESDLIETLAKENLNSKELTKLISSTFLTQRDPIILAKLVKSLDPLLSKISEPNLQLLSVIAVLKNYRLSNEIVLTSIDFALNRIGQTNTIEFVICVLNEFDENQRKRLVDYCSHKLKTDPSAEDLILMCHLNERSLVQEFRIEQLMRFSLIPQNIIALCTILIKFDKLNDLNELHLQKLLQYVETNLKDKREPIPIDPCHKRLMSTTFCSILELLYLHPNKFYEQNRLLGLMSQSILHLIHDQYDLRKRMLSMLVPEHYDLIENLIGMKMFERSTIEQACGISFHIDNNCPIHYMFPLEWHALIGHFLAKSSCDGQNHVLISGLKLWLDIETKCGKHLEFISKSTRLTLLISVLYCLQKDRIALVIADRTINELTIEIFRIYLTQDFLSSSSIDLNEINSYSRSFWEVYDQMLKVFDENVFDNGIFALATFVPLICEHYQRLAGIEFKNEQTMISHVFENPVSVFNRFRMRKLSSTDSMFVGMISPLLSKSSKIQNFAIAKSALSYLQRYPCSIPDKYCLVTAYCIQTLNSFLFDFDRSNEDYNEQLQSLVAMINDSKDKGCVANALKFCGWSSQSGICLLDDMNKRKMELLKTISESINNKT